MSSSKPDPEEWPQVIAPGAFDGCDGQTVDVSAGGSGRIIGRGVIRTTPEGAVIEMQMGGGTGTADVPVPVSFSFVMPAEQDHE